MNTIRWILTVSVPIAVVAAWFLMAPSSPSASQPAASDFHQITDSDPDAPATESSPAEPRPIAVAEPAEFNFGAMDSLQPGTHTFTIRNEGTAPLLLRDAGTTCKCTLSDVPEEPIPPGGSAQVTLRWLTTSASRYYSQTATIQTNDPDHSQLSLRVFGTVRNRVVVEPSSVVFSKVEPDAAAVSEVLVFSELWPRFAIENVACSLEGFTWDIQPVEVPVETGGKSRTAYRISVTCPDDLPQGHFSGVLSFRVVPDGSAAEPQDCEVAVSGKVLRRLAVYGQAIDSSGEVDLGLVPGQQGRTINLVMKVRDRQTDLPVERVEVEPEFVKAHVEADSPEAAERGLYRLTVEIPPGAPVSDYLGATPGRLKLSINHPRIPELELKLKFAVVGGN